MVNSLPHSLQASPPTKKSLGVFSSFNPLGSTSHLGYWLYSEIDNYYFHSRPWFCSETHYSLKTIQYSETLCSLQFTLR